MSFLDSKKWHLNPADLYPELHAKRVIEVNGVHYLSPLSQWRPVWCGFEMEGSPNGAIRPNFVGSH